MEYYYICVDDEGNECGFDGNKPQWCDETDVWWSPELTNAERDGTEYVSPVQSQADRYGEYLDEGTIQKILGKTLLFEDGVVKIEKKEYTKIFD